MGTAFMASGVMFFSIRQRTIPQRQRILALMNLFTGVMLLVMGSGHLLAVTIKLLQGTLRGSALLFYVIGVAVVAPAWFVIWNTRAILATAEARTTVKLNAWIAITPRRPGSREPAARGPGVVQRRLRSAPASLGRVDVRDHRVDRRCGALHRRRHLHGQ